VFLTGFLTTRIVSADSVGQAKDAAGAGAVAGQKAAVPAETPGFWIAGQPPAEAAAEKPTTEQILLKWRYTGQWNLYGLQDAGVSNGVWKLKATKGHAMMYSPSTVIDTENQPVAIFQMKLWKGIAAKGCILFVPESEPGFADDRIVLFNCQSDGESHVYEVDMSKHKQWKGKIKQVRLQPFDVADSAVNSETAVVQLDYFRFPDLR